MKKVVHKYDAHVFTVHNCKRLYNCVQLQNCTMQFTVSVIPAVILCSTPLSLN